MTILARLRSNLTGPFFSILHIAELKSAVGEQRISSPSIPPCFSSSELKVGSHKDAPNCDTHLIRHSLSTVIHKTYHCESSNSHTNTQASENCLGTWITSMLETDLPVVGLLRGSVCVLHAYRKTVCS
jgi:hypothetical protein